MKPDRCDRVSTYLCMTKDVGVGGNLFGGTMMAWMDEAAGIFAHQHTGVIRMVTLRYTDLLFRHPVRVGDIVEFFAQNAKQGRTSLTFDLQGWVEDNIVVETTCTFVAVDEEGKPVPIESAH